MPQPTFCKCLVVAERGNGANYEQDNGATGAGQPCPEMCEQKRGRS